MKSEELHAAYARTDYKVSDDGVHLTLRVNETNSAMDALLTKFQTNSAAFLTAHNPFSRQLQAAENEKRQATLISILQEKGWRFFHGSGESRTGECEPEPSVLIIGIEYRDALNLARQFEQNAFLLIEKNKPPQLKYAF